MDIIAEITTVYLIQIKSNITFVSVVESDLPGVGDVHHADRAVQ